MKLKEQAEKNWILEKSSKDRKINMLSEKIEELEAKLWKENRGISSYDDAKGKDRNSNPFLLPSLVEEWTLPPCG